MGVEEEGPEGIVDGESDVEVRRVEVVAGDIGNPVVDFALAAGGAEAGLAGNGHAAIKSAVRADVTSVACAGIAAEDHTFDGLADIGALVWWDLFFEVQITPGVPVFTEYLAEAVVGSGAGRVTPGERGLSLIG